LLSRTSRTNAYFYVVILSGRPRDASAIYIYWKWTGFPVSPSNSAADPHGAGPLFREHTIHQ